MIPILLLLSCKNGKETIQCIATNKSINQLALRCITKENEYLGGHDLDSNKGSRLCTFFFENPK